MGKKLAIVTGATSGIGMASAFRLSSCGFNVAAVGRNREALEELESKVEGLASFEFDLGDVDEIGGLVDRIVDRFARIDVLVNAAGVIGMGSIEDTSLDDWDSMLNINLRSVFALTKHAVPFLERSKGNIVNVSSVAGTRAFPNVLAYCVSKAGVDQLTRCTALELAPKGIRVNAVNPGVVVSNLHKRGGMSAEEYQSFLDHSATTHPLGRPGTAEEVADLISFLASDKAAWITGVTYDIDGGRAQTCAR